MTEWISTVETDLDHVDVWIFDLDNTLYPAACRLFDQVDRLMGEFVARLLGTSVEDARIVQKKYFREHGTTLRGLMVNHDIDPRDFLDFVHDIDVSRVSPDPRLDSALSRLPGRRIVFTNGSVEHANRVMGRLGVANRFEAVFDIVAADFVPKPEPAVYDRMIERLGVDPERAILFEDIPKNLAPASDRGMTTVLVHDPAHAPDWVRGGLDEAMPHIDHVTDDLAGWLEQAVAGPDAGRYPRR